MLERNQRLLIVCLLPRTVTPRKKINVAADSLTSAR